MISTHPFDALFSRSGLHTVIELRAGVFGRCDSIFLPSVWDSFFRRRSCQCAGTSWGAVRSRTYLRFLSFLRGRLRRFTYSSARLTGCRSCLYRAAGGFTQDLRCLRRSTSVTRLRCRRLHGWNFMHPFLSLWRVRVGLHRRRDVSGAGTPAQHIVCIRFFYHFPPLTDLFAAITRLLWWGFALTPWEL